MADISPFRGLRYSPSVAGSLTDLLCPPYDVITPEQQQALQRSSPYNAVHLELPAEGTQERYAIAAQALAQWQHDGVLLRDSRPSYYILRHRFTHKSHTLERWGLTARVRLEEFHRQVILPHEETNAAPKADRLRLMEACRANLSPIMSFYRDPRRRIRSVMERLAEPPPSAIATYDDSQELALWVVDAPELDGAVQATLQDAPLFIADGHHRYETALLYRDQARQRSEGRGESDAFNYVMMTLIDFDDPGLLVLPYHRTLGGMDPPTLTAVRNQLLKMFQLQPFTAQPTTPEALEEAVAQQDKDVSLGLLGPDGEGPYLLTLRQDALETLLALPGGTTMRDSEGWVLHQAVLEPALGDAGQHLTYVHDPQEAWDSVVRGRQQMAFFLKPFPMDLFQAVVSTGQRLPPQVHLLSPQVTYGPGLQSPGGRGVGSRACLHPQSSIAV